MDTSGLPESLRARIAERSALPPIEKVRALLHGYVHDSDGFDEVREELRDTAQTSTFYLEQYLTALETILAEPQPEGTYLRLVAGDGNRGLDDPSDAEAIGYLRRLLETLRTVIAEAHG
ncbi:hypothetical protein Ade02nite_42240 [Paractinoplanes deccanensis]|uniref:CdiI immunity protein domain-containing protein n=1 Tax=Paractinoplanes deccanensis TaxID=113561 RepID=A0ABQ3Y6I4_9ACTN|nr:hypothetical protein [Actinoplanes deccanensis]GID75583.1 hypothetical protein Ade02nite_42240 [Actinoplanes deccanensis]